MTLPKTPTKLKATLAKTSINLLNRANTMVADKSPPSLFAPLHLLLQQSKKRAINE
jgi:hypothetical protein